MTSWKAQITEGKYELQFETTNYEIYKEVEKVAQKMVDKEDKKRTNGLAKMSARGELRA